MRWCRLRTYWIKCCLERMIRAYLKKVWRIIKPGFFLMYGYIKRKQNIAPIGKLC